MATVEEIVAAAERLSSGEFKRLRKKLDRLEEKAWDQELMRTSQELRRRKVTDAVIDRKVLRRRRESRP